MKSILMSETESENPLFACMLYGYRVERNTFYNTRYHGLDAYEKNGGPIKHLITKKQSSHMMKTYSLIGRSCFSATMKFINEAKLNVLDKTPIFQIPISEDQARQILIFDQYLGKRFKNTDALRNAVITYPQDDLLFVKVQIALGKRFKPTIISHW